MSKFSLRPSLLEHWSRVRVFNLVFVVHLFDIGWSKDVEVKAVLTDGGVWVPGLGTAKVPEELVPGLHASVGKALGF